jgi:anti-sigma regulatory factor (Ser/Thr protein kinase)
MCRLARAEFDAAASAPSAARHWVNGLLDRWELSQLSDVATLLTSEVVSNAIRHTAEGHTKLTVAVADGVLEIGVTDADKEHLPERQDSLDSSAESGRGLAIVEAMSEGWGVNLLPEGKEIWFLLDAVDWPHRLGCGCSGEGLTQVMLESGRQLPMGSEPFDDLDFLSETG